MSPVSGIAQVAENKAAVQTGAELALQARAFACLAIDRSSPEIGRIGQVERRCHRHGALAIVPIEDRMNPQASRRAQPSGLTCRLEIPLSDATLVETMGAASSNAT